MNCHEPSNRERNVSDRINPEREKNYDDARSGILTEMCPEHIKTHVHLNFARLPDYAAVRSEIETSLEARQSGSNPDAMDIAVSVGRKVCVTRGDSEDIGQQSASNVARRVKSGKGKTGDGKGQVKGGKGQVREAFEWALQSLLEWGGMEKDCFTLAKPKGKGVKGKSAGSLDETETFGPGNSFSWWIWLVLVRKVVW